MIFLQFNSQKMGDDIPMNSREELEQDLNDFQLSMSQTLDSFNQWANYYGNKMQESLNDVEYFSLGDLAILHHTIKSEAVSEVWIELLI